MTFVYSSGYIMQFLAQMLLVNGPYPYTHEKWELLHMSFVNKSGSFIQFLLKMILKLTPPIGGSLAKMTFLYTSGQFIQFPVKTF